MNGVAMTESTRGENGSMIRIVHAAENMSTIRRPALNPVKGEKWLKSAWRRNARERAGTWSIRERYSDSLNKMRLPRFHLNPLLTPAQSAHIIRL